MQTKEQLLEIVEQYTQSNESLTKVTFIFVFNNLGTNFVLFLDFSFFYPSRHVYLSSIKVVFFNFSMYFFQQKKKRKTKYHNLDNLLKSENESGDREEQAKVRGAESKQFVASSKETRGFSSLFHIFYFSLVNQASFCLHHLFSFGVGCGARIILIYY